MFHVFLFDVKENEEGVILKDCNFGGKARIPTTVFEKAHIFRKPCSLRQSSLSP